MGKHKDIDNFDVDNANYRCVDVFESKMARKNMSNTFIYIVM